MINILIPLAGKGSRFQNANYTKPKPFIDVSGIPMILRVLENLFIKDANYILIAQNEHIKNEWQIIQDIKAKYNATILGIDGITEGTACTILHAKSYINNSTPLLIANSDQIVDMQISDFVNDAKARNLNGSILCFKDLQKNPKWSFAKVENGFVTSVKEKEAISDLATVGIYFFKNGSDFVNAATEMIAKNDRVNGEFYTCPTYNYLIANGLKIGVYCINAEQMHGIGTPEDLQTYIRSKAWQKS